jgi:hypothetical protein
MVECGFMSWNLFNGNFANIRPDKFIKLHDEKFGPRGQAEWSKKYSSCSLRDTTRK